MLINLNFINKEFYQSIIEKVDSFDENKYSIEQYKQLIINERDKQLEIDITVEYIQNLTKKIYDDLFYSMFNTHEIKKINYINELNKLDENKLFYFINYLNLLNEIEYYNVYLTDEELVKEINKQQKLIDKNYFFETLNIINFLYKRNNVFIKSQDNFKIDIINTKKNDLKYTLDFLEEKDKKSILISILNSFKNKKIYFQEKNLIEIIKYNQCNFGLDEKIINDLYISYDNIINVDKFEKIKKDLLIINNTNLNRKLEIDFKSLNKEIGLFETDKTSDFQNALKQLEIINKQITEEEIVNNFLTSDKELKEKNKEEQKLLNSLEEIINKLEDMMGGDLTTGISNIFNGITEYYDLVKTGNKQHLNNLNLIFDNSFNKESLFSKDFCAIIYLIIYTLYSAIDEEPLENINDSKEYEEKKKSLKGIKSLPGYLEINQIKFENWDAKAKFIKDSKFFKSYSNFYSFYTKDKNPFNKSLKDKDFEFMQDLAITAKSLLESTEQNKMQETLNNLFYKPINNSNHSIYTYVELISDLFQEFNEPVEFELLENFGISLISYLKNLALETGSSLLLEWTLELFSKEFINISGNKYSIMSIYNELYMLKKILYLIKDEDGSLDDLLRMNLTDISSTVLNDSKLGQILKEEAYFALNGLDFSNSLIYDINKLFNNTENHDGFYTSLLYTYKQTNALGEVNTYIWNLKAVNLPAWVTMKYIINKYKTIDPELVTLNFQSKSFFNNQLIGLSQSENSYCYLSSILNKKYYIEFLNKELSLNYSESEILEILELLPSSVNDNIFNYYESYNQLNTKYFKILNLTHLYDYKVYKSSIKKDFNLFHRVVNYNYDAILDAILSGENSPLIDTIMRLLPTTRLLFGTFNLPLDKYLDKLLSWFDELLFSLLNYFKKLMYENKIKFVENYKRERLYLIKNTWDYRIRAFNILLDIIYSNIGVASFCLSNDYKNDKDILIDIYQQIIDKIESNNLEDIKNDLENPKDPNIKIPDFPNVINPDLSTEDKDKIIEDINNSINNKIIVVDKETNEDGKNIIIIFPGNEENIEDKYNENKDTIITKPIDKPEDLVEELKKDETIKLEINFDEDWMNNLIDYLKPGHEDIKKDIFESYVTKDLNHLFYQNTNGNHIYSKNEILSNRYNDLNNSSIQYSDSGFIKYINFNKINFKLFNETLSNFDFENYNKIKQTSLEFFNNF